MPGSTRASAIRDARMTAITPTPASDVADSDASWRARTPLEKALNFCRRKPLGVIGLLIVVVFALAGGFADWIAPFDPEENDFNSMMVAPSLLHLLGTDQASAPPWAAA